MAESEQGEQPTRAPRARGALLGQAALGLALIAGFLVVFGPKLGLEAPILTKARAALGLAAAAPEAEEKGGRRKGGREAPPILTAIAKAARDDRVLELISTAAANRSAELRPRAAGRVTERRFEPGQRLEAGVVVLTLDDSREKLALARAEATLKEAESQLERQRSLRRSGSASVAALESAETAAALARIARDEAAEALADRRIETPFAGVISRPLVEIGDRIDTDAAIATLDDRSVLLLEADAPETAFGRLEVGLPVSAASAAFPGESFAGRLAEIDSRIDPANRTLRLRAEIPNQEDRLRPGMSFVLKLDLRGPEAIAAPELALQWERAGAYVWRVQGGEGETVTVERVAVVLLSRDGGRALMRDAGETEPPLSVGDELVVEGVQRLKEGGRARRLRPAPSAEAAR